MSENPTIYALAFREKGILIKNAEGCGDKKKNEGRPENLFLE